MKADSRPFILRRVPFAFIAILLAIVFVFVSWYFYNKAKTSKDEFDLKLGEHALNIAIVVLIGAAIKEFIDWRTLEKDRLAKNESLRMEFFKRIMDIHLRIMYSRDLMQAHMSAKTWSEQSRELMQRIRELAELYEDLSAAPDLFTQQDSILEGINGIMEYLEGCRKEYMKNHIYVDIDWKKSHGLRHTIKKYNMVWFKYFVAESKEHETGYTKNLQNAKFAMREEVYKTK